MSLNYLVNKPCNNTSYNLLKKKNQKNILNLNKETT